MEGSSVYKRFISIGYHGRVAHQLIWLSKDGKTYVLPPVQFGRDPPLTFVFVLLSPFFIFGTFNSSIGIRGIAPSNLPRIMFSWASNEIHFNAAGFDPAAIQIQEALRIVGGQLRYCIRCCKLIRTLQSKGFKLTSLENTQLSCFTNLISALKDGRPSGEIWGSANNACRSIIREQDNHNDIATKRVLNRRPANPRPWAFDSDFIEPGYSSFPSAWTTPRFVNVLACY